jgi:hypothetical protein
METLLCCQNDLHLRFQLHVIVLRAIPPPRVRIPGTARTITKFREFKARTACSAGNVTRTALCNRDYRCPSSFPTPVQQLLWLGNALNLFLRASRIESLTC